MLKTENSASQMYGHFAKVAGCYNKIRTTDPGPVSYIRHKLKDKKSIWAVDIGCGGGRYDLLLFRQLPGLHLICNDVNESMVAETARYLEDRGVTAFSTVQSDISNLQLTDGSLDCILTFNAIHHFDPATFLHKAAKALGENGHVFIYTRLKCQNAGNIWGRFFPGFLEKEGRLYDLADVERWKNIQDALNLTSIEFFMFKRVATLEQLVHQAENRHYSTFSLYSAQEFDRALGKFRKYIDCNFSDHNRIEWFDENVMIVFRKQQTSV